MTGLKKSIIVCLVISTFLVCEAFGRDLVVVRDTTSGLHIDNGLVAIDLQKIDGCVVSKFKARNSKGQWQDVCESFRPDFKSASEGNKFFDIKFLCFSLYS